MSLEGLSLGDAFGEQFFLRSGLVEQLIAQRALPAAPWPFTDDTQMALSVVASLARFGHIDQDWLARSFAEHYTPRRGYGPAMHGLLRQIRDGAEWRTAASAQFGGQGSFGNGAAMRVAPLGTYWADDLELVVEQAALSAEVTHTHREAIAGAVAVAVAAGLTWRHAAGSGSGCHAAGSDSGRLEPGSDSARLEPDADSARMEADEFLELVAERVPASEVREGIGRARRLGSGASVQAAVAALGNGERVSAQDTVPFALWCAARHLRDDVASALWTTVSGLGDRDTTCAMVGGILAGRVGQGGLPSEWLSRREPLPDWAWRQL